MSVLKFESEEALRFSITSGLVPDAVLASPARTWRDGKTAIVVAPEGAVPAETLKKLAAAGVSREPATTVSAASSVVRCWAEILGVRRMREQSPRRLGGHDAQQRATDGASPAAGARSTLDDGDTDEIGQVLFVLPDGEALCDLAGELLRLGCDRLEWRTGDEGSLLRAAAPPYYTLVRAMDRTSRVRAYVPSPKGQDRVFVEIGHTHPLARFLRPDPGHVLLVSPSSSNDGAGPTHAEFTMLRDGAFADVYTLVDLRVPADTAPPRVLEAVDVPPRLAVTLRLARAAAVEAPTLWVIRENAVTKVERLLASLPEEISRGLLFSPCRVEGETIIILRSRSGTRTATLEIDGEAYRAHASIANLFLPCDATLEPPLRRDRVRDLLAPEADTLVWLRPLGRERFQVERAADEAFHPLSEWVEYVIDESAATLVPWVKACTFDFDAFVGVDAVAARVRPQRDDDDDKKPRRAQRAEPDPFPQPVRTPARAAATRTRAQATLEAAHLDANVAAEELSRLEKEFLALDVPVDHPSRGQMWQRMAALNASLGRRHDAALSWARVVWELPAADVHEAAAPWAEAEQRVVHGASLKTLLALDAPGPGHVPALAAMIIAADGASPAAGARSTPDDPSLRELAQDASLWLDAHDAALDIRTAWLVRIALARLVGGDRLGLARARDRLLARIHDGLSVDRDVPAFLRRAGAGRDAAQVEILAGKLAALHDRFEATKRKRSATEADPKLTGAYVRFVVAFGAARLGRREWAMQLRDAATRALPASDALHDILSRAFTARIGHALEGLPAETPLPAELSAQLNALAKLDRYKVDRVRQCSKVLEPQERLDPILAFQRGEADPRGPEFAVLRGLEEPAAIAEAVAAIVTKARSSDADERARLYDGVMDFFLMIPHERALEHLEELLGRVSDVPGPRRVQLLEEALMLAGHLGEETFARKIFATLEPLVASIGPDGATEIAPLVAGMLRTLRRFGLKDEAARLLTATQAAATGKATAHLVARLHTAAGLAYLGDMDRARPVFEEALSVLSGDLPMPERLQLTRAVARALGTAPLEYAVAGLDQLQNRLDIVSDSFNTNTHVCLSVLDIMEALVLGYASDDLAVGQAGRKLLDDDEYLVRRRIHRDLSQMK